MKNTFADNMAFLKVDKLPEPYKHSGQFLKQEIAEDILSRWTSSPYLPISNWITNVCTYHEKRGGIPVSNGIPATENLRPMIQAALCSLKRCESAAENAKGNWRILPEK